MDFQTVGVYQFRHLCFQAATTSTFFKPPFIMFNLWDDFTDLHGNYLKYRGRRKTTRT